jgi:hypothetical protein
MHHRGMSLKTILLKTVWVPLVWMAVTLLDIVMFADGGPKNQVSRIFESFVFVVNFLIYALRWQLREISPASRLLVPVVLQFSFWWLFAIVIFTILQNLKKRRVQ